MYNLFLENSDLLESEILDDLNTDIKEKDSESETSYEEMMCSIYEDFTFLVEQDTQIFMQLRYCEVISEGVASSIWETVKNVFSKIVEHLKKFKDYLFGSEGKVKKLMDKISTIGANQEEMLEKRAKDPNFMLNKVYVSDDIIKFISNYKPYSSCALLNTIVDSLNEYVDFCSKMSNALTADNSKNESGKDLFFKECPSFLKIEKQCDGDTSKLFSMVMNELNLPFDQSGNTSEFLKKHIQVEGEVTAKEYLDKYYKDAEAFKKEFQGMITDNTIKKDNETYIKKASGLSDELFKLSRKETSPYKPMSAKFFQLSTAVLKVLLYGDSIITKSSKAVMTHLNNMTKCVGGKEKDTEEA